MGTQKSDPLNEADAVPFEVNGGSSHQVRAQKGTELFDVCRRRPFEDCRAKQLRVVAGEIEDAVRLSGVFPDRRGPPLSGSVVAGGESGIGADGGEARPSEIHQRERLGERRDGAEVERQAAAQQAHDAVIESIRALDIV